MAFCSFQQEILQKIHRYCAGENPAPVKSCLLQNLPLSTRVSALTPVMQLLPNVILLFVIATTCREPRTLFTRALIAYYFTLYEADLAPRRLSFQNPAHVIRRPTRGDDAGQRGWLNAGDIFCQRAKSV